MAIAFFGIKPNAGKPTDYYNVRPKSVREYYGSGLTAIKNPRSCVFAGQLCDDWGN